MEILALLFIVGVANAGRLENSYLPPGGLASVRPGAGGSGFVQAPSGLFNGVYNAVQAQSSSSAGSYREYSAGRSGQAIAITRYDNQNLGDGSYKYNYETANGISAEETGATRGDGKNVAGFYSYTGTDGQKYTVHYTADENGFHAEGAHLPTPPPIPEDIRRGVELSLAAEARGENQGGSFPVYNKYQALSAGGYSY